jgi:hypothetical protein
VPLFAHHRVAMITTAAPCGEPFIQRAMALVCPSLGNFMFELNLSHSNGQNFS